METAEKMIDENTIAICASASDYAYGIIDPIKDIAELALKKNIGFHVDGCLGGFFLPFAQRVKGWIDRIPDFDFKIKGVTSISLDTHKYGYGPKGLSIVLFRTKLLAKYQGAFYFWENGFYGSHHISENKSGAIIAGSWVIMRKFGFEEYK